jgi:hypothetical protein
MPKIVVLGSLRHSPYEILKVPEPVDSIKEGFDPQNRKEFDTEQYYQEACEKFYPAMDACDEVWVYMPEGRIGDHTQRDLDYAISQGKRVFLVQEVVEPVDSKEDLPKIEEDWWQHHH